ncbi:MAG TPA: hypothetical protein VF720_05895 [Candidatus Eisenbacteria bacterium]
MRPILSILAPVIVVAALASCLIALPDARASTNDGKPKITLHVGGATVKNPCVHARLSDCMDAVTEGGLDIPYYAYLLVARGTQPSIAGAQFGIYYTGTYEPNGVGQGVNVFGWTLCATLEFASPSPAWPSPGSGTLLTWDSVTDCQTGDVAVGGYFYLTAYDPGIMFVGARPVDSVVKVATCEPFEYEILPGIDTGSAYFSSDLSAPGCNACMKSCIDPVEPATWSGIKAGGGR